MALKTFVKVGGINNLSDARYCAGMEADLLGFCVEEKDENFISPEDYKEMREWLSGVGYVVEFGKHSETLPQLNGIISEYQPDFVQVHLQDLPKATLAQNIIAYAGIQEIPDMMNLLVQQKAAFKYLLITSESDVIGDTDWQVIDNLQSIGIAVILGFGINTDTAESIASTPTIAGISLMGGNEIKPGLKDFDELADILELLEVNDLN